LVDDDSSVRNVSTRILRRLGYEVHDLEDGALMEEYLKKNTPDVVLMDIVMPVNGGDVVTQMLVKERGFKVPIFACTANTSSEDLARYRAIGFSGVSPKPFDSTDLSDKLQLLSRKTKLSCALRQYPGPTLSGVSDPDLFSEASEG
jgi:CheY-like chemotaxis protein